MLAFLKIVEVRLKTQNNRILFFTLILSTWLNQANAKVYEFGNCINSSSEDFKDYGLVWNKETYDLRNSVYYRIPKNPKERKFKEGSIWDVIDFENAYDFEEAKWFKEDGYKKIKKLKREVYSIDTSNATVTKLIERHDQFMKFNTLRIQKLTPYIGRDNNYKTSFGNGKFYKWPEDEIKMIQNMKRTQIEKFKIVDYVGGIIIAHDVKDLNKIPEHRRGLKIDLNNLTVVRETIDRIHNEYQSFFSLCATSTTTATSNKTDQKNNGTNQTLKSILKLLK